MLWASDGVRPFEGSRAPTWVAHTSTAIRQASPTTVAAASGILALARGERGAVLRMTMIRDEVRELVALGPLPATVGVDELRSVDEHRELLGRIVGPVTLEEARLLLKLFGPDDCDGLAWALLHLIESAPEHVLDRAPSAVENEWVHRL